MSEKRIDYIIVLDRKIKNSRKLNHIVKFIKSLEERGLNIQIKHGKRFVDNVYIAVHLPSHAIEGLANMYNINIHNAGHTYLPHSALYMQKFKFFETPLSKGEDLFRRERPGFVSNAERIIIVDEVLNEAQFGENENEAGLEKLIAFDLAKDAYPLHDGDYQHENGDGGFSIPENDRQLLYKYWANFSFWYKEQPLNLIQKYYGSEVAFYFAWVGFYNTMLIPAAIVGVCFTVGSIIQMLAQFQERVYISVFYQRHQKYICRCRDDICTSKLMMCPLCHTGKNCHFKPLNNSCEYAKVSIIFDNRWTVVFGVFMSFWATFFLNLWKRLENTLKIQWNVEFDEIDSKTRTEYKEKCSERKWSYLTEKLEPYTPPIHKIISLSLSFGTCIILAFIVLVFLFGVVMYRVQMTTLMRITGDKILAKHSHFLLTLSSAFIQVLFIKLFSLFYTQLSEWLTHLENPRTQTEFDNAVIHKRYFLGISNNYAGLFYIAFFQGRFYSPNEPTSPTGYETDLCHPSGCFMSLCVQLCVLMLFQSFLGNTVTLILPKIKKKITKKQETDDQWEKEYKLKPADRYLLANEYSELIVQFGFVTFFVTAFPLAPLCAVLSNYFELRLDAYKLLTRHRRPVPRQHSGIGAWNNILSMITHLSIATNAFVLAFTSDFVGREIYRARNNQSLDGYVKSTLSLYDMRDFKGDVGGTTATNPMYNSSLCYYKSMRYPPDHKLKYKLTPTYWFHIGMKLLCVIIFEHLIMLTNGVLAYFIPDMPHTVKETLHHERNKMLELKLKAQPGDTSKTRKRTTVNIKRWERL